MKSKTPREDRTVAEWKNVAKATRRRRRILQAGFFLCHRKLRPMTQKTLRGIALRRSGRVSRKRPAAGGESCEQDSFSY